MKREGRQHGMVRAFLISPSSPCGARPVPRFNRVEPTAGDFARVPSKPTNHSKFTGKWSRHHHHPVVDKPAPKPKRAHKIRSQDALYNLAGISATGMLHHLQGDYVHDSGDELEDDDDDGVGEGPGGLDLEFNLNTLQPVTAEIRDGGDETDHQNRDDVAEINDDDDDDEDKMSFCEVGFVVDLEEGEEDWCLVEQL